MALNSCLYDCRIMHQRLWPKRHGFRNSVFLFYLDLDELPRLSEFSAWLGWNRRALYSFYDKDHLPFSDAPLKERVRQYLVEQGVETEPVRVMLLTSLRFLGYVFNPVSFYYCFDGEDRPFCAIAEINNTFLETKLFLVPPASDLDGDARGPYAFESLAEKLFYISPYSALSNRMSFKLNPPDARVGVFVDEMSPDVDLGKAPEADAENRPERGLILVSSITGKQAPLTTGSLFGLTLKHPFVTFQVIFFIHFHAFLLFLKGLKVFLKEENPHLQQNMFNPRFPRRRALP